LNFSTQHTEQKLISLNYNNFEVNPKEAFKKMYYENNQIKDDVIIFDLRNSVLFQKYKLFFSKNKFSEEILSDIKIADKKVFLICEYGYKSIDLAVKLREKNVEAWSIKGGIMEWSNLNLPREKSEICNLVTQTTSNLQNLTDLRTNFPFSKIIPILFI
jgi:rhodanese-related sulfurtransferase